MTSPKPKKKTIKAWAVVMFDGFLPDFSIENKMTDVFQIHSSKMGAEFVVSHIDGEDRDEWKVVPCTITYHV